MSRFPLVFVLVCLVTPAARGTDVPFDPEAVFSLKCAGCHRVGGGDLVGPDLAGVTERRERPWLVAFIRSSQSLVRSGDPTAVALFERFEGQKMPDHDFSAEQVAALLAFIEAGGPRGGSREVRHAESATAQEIAMGRELFWGQRALSQGGAACASCHSVGERSWLGSALASDLTGVYRKYQDRGLTKALDDLDFPLMATVYEGRPLTEEEAFCLKAFLYQAARAGARAREVEALPSGFLLAGFAGPVVLFGAADLARVLRRRKRRQAWTRGDR